MCVFHVCEENMWSGSVQIFTREKGDFFFLT